ncbi:MULTISPECIES: hypothetical protein [Hymenobacter]|uniref:SpoIIAA-like n=1 Tax=Hymenobacter mucosus TaxID=1411120 RepID=A0A238Z021_9BACT|nr:MULTISPECIES: hypothetical protein [Hymenobacter]SNR76301.1 hypothetical protein SAMN06269173_106204 [Hymenobacter mucosus]
MIHIHDSLYLQVSSPLHLLRWEWHDLLSYDRFRAAFKELLVLSNNYHITNWLADLSTMPLVGTDEQAWLSDEWLPEFARLSIQHLAIIQPPTMHNQLVIESVLSDGRRCNNADVQFFSDIPSALDWLTSSSSVATQLEQEWLANTRMIRSPSLLSRMWI